MIFKLKQCLTIITLLCCSVLLVSQPVVAASQSWGANWDGQLGTGDFISQSTPTVISGNQEFSKITAGYRHSLGLKPDGTVWGWGLNDFYQASGSVIAGNISTPTQISALSNIIDVAAGTYHSAALRQDGTLWTWGHGGYGALGLGNFINATVPTQVSITNVVAIASNGYHTLALKADGTVWGWGSNHQGQVGTGSPPSTVVNPIQVASLTNVISIAAGTHHSLALKADGTVWAWGYNYYGQLGNGATLQVAVATPIQTSSLNNVVAITAGVFNSLAIKSDGTAWAWGYNRFGQAGNGSTSFAVPIPSLVPGLSNVTSIAAGYHSLATKSDGTIWSWGYNYSGGLGLGTTGQPVLIPTQVNISGVNAIAAGWFHSLAFTSNAVSNQPPLADAGIAQTAESTGSSSANVTLNGSASSDPNGDALTYAWSWAGGTATGVNPTASFPLGTTTVVLTVDDGNGATATATTTVTVEDTIAPVVSAGADVIIEATSVAGATYDVASQVAASDVGCGVSTYISPVGIYALGSTTVNVTATDCVGNSASDTMIVNVQDTTAPVLTVPADIVAEATGAQTTVATGTATATDIFTVTITSDAPATYALGTTVVTWTATDANGNVSTSTQSVTVIDTTPPSVTAPADITIEATANPNTPYMLSISAIATDLIGVVSVTNNAPASYPFGVITQVTWTATDAAGNSATAVQNVVVQDTTAPVLTVPADIVAEATGAQTTVATGTATATDIFTVTITSDAPATYALGTTVVTWTVTDANGNISTASQNVTVADTTAPIVTANLVPFGQGDEEDDDKNNDSDEGRFIVQFTASDIVDANLVVTAELIINGYATPVTVTNGQLIEFEYEDEKTEVEVEKGIVEIEAPSMVLRITATDASGNTTLVDVQPQGLTPDNDNETTDHDD